MIIIKTIDVGKSGLIAPAILAGCMRIGNMSIQQADTFVKTALECGVTMFDHADIYGAGSCEELFGKVLAQTPSLRERMLIQTKCGIRQGYYDFSKEHILASVDSSLQRLHTDHLDLLLLHRPDTLMEPEEVAEAFGILQSNGKVRHFGVSNQNPAQMELLQRALPQKLIANQLQLSMTNTGMIDSGVNVNTKGTGAVDRDGSVLEYCRLKEITIQAWSPFQYGFFEGVFLGNEKFPHLNQMIDQLAKQYQVSNSAIAAAWILRHPADMQVVLGTTNPQRLSDIAGAADIHLTRQEWYGLYRAAGNSLP